MSILIAVPTYETIAPETFRSIYRIKGDDLSFDYVKGYDCAKARNDIVRKALDGAFDYVLMVDSDIVVPEDALINMLEIPAPIVFGVYPRKNKPGETELFRRGTWSFEIRYTMDELNAMDKDRVKIKGSGFGCALINTRVFKELAYPWFKFVSYENNTYLSEDLYFCMMAENYDLQADLRVKCGHIGRTVQY